MFCGGGSFKESLILRGLSYLLYAGGFAVPSKVRVHLQESHVNGKRGRIGQSYPPLLHTLTCQRKRHVLFIMAMDPLLHLIVFSGGLALSHSAVYHNPATNRLPYRAPRTHHHQLIWTFVRCDITNTGVGAPPLAETASFKTVSHPPSIVPTFLLLL